MMQLTGSNGTHSWNPESVTKGTWIFLNIRNGWKLTNSRLSRKFFPTSAKSRLASP